MHLQTKEEVKIHIGNKPLFKKLPRTKSVLGYASGIRELTLENSMNQLPETFSIVQYPNGILIVDRKGKYRIGLAYSDLKGIEITKQGDDRYVVTFITSASKPVAFYFQKKDYLQIVPFIKLLPQKEENDPRDEKTAREAILKLRNEFASDYFTDRTFCQPLSSVVKKSVLLDINESRIKYGNRVIEASSALGYTISIEKVSHYGVSRFEYKVGIHHPEEHLFISFTSVGFLAQEGEDSELLGDIGLVLFDVVSRPVVARWFDRFANGESIDYEEFSLSRQGMLLKNRTSDILIHWDEIVTQSTDLFRWPYSNTVFQRIDSSYDNRGNMLFFLIRWLQADPNRLLALMGRTYYIS